MSSNRGRCSEASVLLAFGAGLLVAVAAGGEVLYRERFESAAPGAPPAEWREIALDVTTLPVPALLVVQEEGNRAFGRLAEGRQRLAERLDLSRVPLLAWDAGSAFELAGGETIRGRVRPGDRAGGGPALVSGEGDLLLAFTLDGARIALTGIAGDRELDLAWDSTGRWIEFEIAAGDEPADEIRVRVWPEGAERALLPQVRSDGAAAGIESFHPGVIARGGSLLIDDLEIRRESDDPAADEEPPVITIRERDAPFEDGSLEDRAVTPVIAVED